MVSLMWRYIIHPNHLLLTKHIVSLGLSSTYPKRKGIYCTPHTALVPLQCKLVRFSIRECLATPPAPTSCPCRKGRGGKGWKAVPCKPFPTLQGSGDNLPWAAEASSTLYQKLFMHLLPLLPYELLNRRDWAFLKSPAQKLAPGK